jgi:hypothetical protein
MPSKAGLQGLAAVHAAGRLACRLREMHAVAAGCQLMFM